MTTSLIVYQPPGFLTFEEWMLCRGAVQCGFRGLFFIESIYALAAFRAMGIPKMLVREPDAYSYASAREDYWKYYGRPSPRVTRP